MSRTVIVDVPRTLLGLGIDGIEYGDEFLAPCPKHFERTGKEDRNPSFSINMNSGLFNCFSCGYKGNIHRLVADMKGISVEEAEETVVRPSLASRKLPKPYVTVKDRTLPESILSRFTRPPMWAMDARSLDPKSCELYGVLWNPMNDSWITPIRAPYTNKLMGWQEKSQTSRMFDNFPAVFLKRSQTLYGLSAYTGGSMVVVESPLDCMRLHSAGITGGVSPMGCQISNTQLDLMSVAGQVIFALDNDTDGLKATADLYRTTKGKLSNVFFFDYGDSTAKDVGDMYSADIYRGIREARSRVKGLVSA